MKTKRPSHYINRTLNTGMRHQHKHKRKTFFLLVFSGSLNPPFSVNKHPSESSQPPPPPQFIRIHTLMESNNARLKNKNKKNNEYKNRKMNRESGLFLCFRPATMDGPVKRLPCPDGLSKPAFTYFAHVGGKEGMVFPKILPSDLAPDINKEEGDGGRREKRAICKLSRILKAVLPRMSLRRAKRKRSSERNLGQSSSFRLEPSNSMKQYLAPNKQNNLSDDEKLRVNSRCYSAPFTSTGPSRSLPRRGDSFRSNSAGPEQRQQDNAQKHGNGGYGFNGGQYYCLLVICLLVLVFWGKIVAIFCTSTWFYLVPRSTRYVSPQDGKEFSGIAFEKYKQKVIMEV